MERPIIFSGGMVQAILAGTKTQTRRVFKSAEVEWVDRSDVTYSNNGEPIPSGWYYKQYETRQFEKTLVSMGPFEPEDWLDYCPYGKPGEVLWCRETWSLAWTPCKGRGIHYLADNTYRYEDSREIEIPVGAWEKLYSLPAPDYCDNKQPRKVRPSIFMPRWASRIRLEILSVRVERLQDISEGDAVAEGIHPMNCIGPGCDATCNTKGCWGILDGYRTLWDSINGKKHPWKENCFVWVLEFKKQEVAL
jgi:hypothetical protein